MPTQERPARSKPLFSGRLAASYWLYFIYLCALAVGASSRETVLYPYASSWLTVRDIESTRLYNDPISFLQGATDISSFGWFTTNTKWISDLWPPGFMILEAGILRFIGNNASIPFPLQLISCLVFAAVLSLLSEALALKRLPIILRYALPLLLFLPEFARSYMLGPYGVLFGEFLAAALFLLGFVLICLAEHRAYQNLLIIAGSAFVALSSYFRSQYEIYVTTLQLSGVAVLLFDYFYSGHSFRDFLSRRKG